MAQNFRYKVGIRKKRFIDHEETDVTMSLRFTDVHDHDHDHAPSRPIRGHDRVVRRPAVNDNK